jgi:HD superfamily phosphohydrolase
MGTAFLARRFVELLSSSDPALSVTAVDQLCVEIAGLIHDLGHGIYSHMVRLTESITILAIAQLSV